MNKKLDIFKLGIIFFVLFTISTIFTIPLAMAYTTGQPTKGLEVPTTSKTYHVTLQDDVQERWVSFNKRMYIPFKDEVYYVYFISATEDTVEYYFTWEDSTIIMNLGETANFDIDKDGTPDITFTVKDIYMQTTTVDFSKYNQKRIMRDRLESPYFKGKFHIFSRCWNPTTKGIKESK
jgi:hypothetical protein